MRTVEWFDLVLIRVTFTSEPPVAPPGPPSLAPSDVVTDAMLDMPNDESADGVATAPGAPLLSLESKASYLAAMASAAPAPHASSIRTRVHVHSSGHSHATRAHSCASDATGCAMQPLHANQLYSPPLWALQTCEPANQAQGMAITTTVLDTASSGLPVCAGYHCRTLLHRAVVGRRNSCHWSFSTATQTTGPLWCAQLFYARSLLAASEWHIAQPSRAKHFEWIVFVEWLCSVFLNVYSPADWSPLVPRGIACVTHAPAPCCFGAAMWQAWI